LPPVPKVIMRLQPMLVDYNTDLREMAAVIRLERALAARILQVSNSAYMGLGSRARSIEEAITRLGFREVRRLVTIVIGMQMMEKPLPAYGLDAKELWRQAVACAIAAEQIAGYIDEDPAAAYALGLLHSVGMVVVNAWAVMVSPKERLVTTGLSRRLHGRRTRVARVQQCRHRGVAAAHVGFSAVGGGTGAGAVSTGPCGLASATGQFAHGGALAAQRGVHREDSGGAARGARHGVAGNQRGRRSPRWCRK
jgi:hypothetical protein